jgi:hypothetical protein
MLAVSRMQPAVRIQPEKDVTKILVLAESKVNDQIRTPPILY